jgi:hypothetical protein
MPFDRAVVDAYAQAIPRGRWFALVGLPFSDDEARQLATLAPRIARVRTWDGARSTADDARANAAYDADAAEVRALNERAILAVSPAALLAVMSAVVDRGLETFFHAADAAARRAGVADETTVRVAAGAVAEAVYRGALAAAVYGPAHRFVRIAALYETGRWPLARIDDTLHVF